jgi:uncharacterized protein (DUF697 family)
LDNTTKNFILKNLQEEKAVTTSTKSAESTPNNASSTEETLGNTVLTDIVASERLSRANNIIKNYVILSMTAGLVPVPLFDLAALTGTQLKMLHSLANHYGVPFKKELGLSLTISLISGTLGVGTAIGLASLAKAFLGIGTVAGSISVPILAGAMTYAVGRMFVRHFERGGTLQNFKPEEVREGFKREFEAGKDVARDLKDEAKTKQSTTPT